MQEKSLYQHLRHDSTLRDLHLTNTRLDLTMPCTQLNDTFAGSQHLPAIMLYDKERYCTTVARTWYLELMQKPYSKDLFSSRPLRKLLPLMTALPSIYPATTLIAAATERCLQFPLENLLNPLTVELEPDNCRVLDVQHLLLAHLEIYSHTVRLFAEEAAHSKMLRKKLERVNLELTDLAQLDSLTGIPNRRAMDQFLHKEWTVGEREKQPLSILMCDIDNFKSFNDKYGHLQGDQALVQVADALHRMIRRPKDLVARFGGEEFIAVLPNTPLQGAAQVAESLRKTVAALQIPHQWSVTAEHLTISIGIACALPLSGTPPETLISEADQALYQAKAAGRNCVMPSDKKLCFTRASVRPETVSSFPTSLRFHKGAHLATQKLST